MTFRKMASMLAALMLAGVPLGGCASTTASDPVEARLQRMMGGQSEMHGGQLARAIAEADRHPLGSQQNPVRVSQPQGQRAYLSRLRCANGRSPTYIRAGNAGNGVFGNIIDNYTVICNDSTLARSAIFMDMYHAGHTENRPVPGFTITGG